MTAHKDLKTVIRTRQTRTGESYTAARAHVMRARADRLGLPDAVPPQDATPRAEAVVLKVGERSARVRLLSGGDQVTFRASGFSEVVPGQLVTLVFAKRWSWLGHAYASGSVEAPRIDVARLGLTPLPLAVFDESFDLREAHQGYESPDPYAPLWEFLTETPRVAYDMDPIAWGAFPDAGDPDECPVGDAMDLERAGDVDGARALLMELTLRDLRCLDAHAHLGSLEFDRNPRGALVHYEIGVRIGDLSFPPGFDGVLPWGRIYNRPFLRCLHGYGLCLWRLGRNEEARSVFERSLSLDPNDNQGVRFCWQAVREGITWEAFRDPDEPG